MLRKVNLRYFFFGIFGYFVYVLSIVQCFRAFGRASEPTILNYTWPIFTIIFTKSFFRKSRRSVPYRVIETLGILSGFLSIMIIATEGRLSLIDLSNISGILWGLLSGASYGLFSAYSSTVPDKDSSVFLISSVFSSLILMAGISLTEISIIKTLTLKDLIPTAILGIVLDGIGYIAWTRANRLAHTQNIPISSIASITLLLPILSLIIVTILLGETQILQPYFALSFFLIVLSLVLCQKTDSITKIIGILRRKIEMVSC
ncbi:MAG: DMT family transporter [Patescibacteria group bacterium]|nr:DMT family transporter [Patescibacteria group bacterium]